MEGEDLDRKFQNMPRATRGTRVVLNTKVEEVVPTTTLDWRGLPISGKPCGFDSYKETVKAAASNSDQIANDDLLVHEKKHKRRSRSRSNDARKESKKAKKKSSKKKKERERAQDRGDKTIQSENSNSDKRPTYSYDAAHHQGPDIKQRRPSHLHTSGDSNFSSRNYTECNGSKVLGGVESLGRHEQYRDTDFRQGGGRITSLIVNRGDQYRRQGRESSSSSSFDLRWQPAENSRVYSSYRNRDCSREQLGGDHKVEARKEHTRSDEEGDSDCSVASVDSFGRDVRPEAQERSSQRSRAQEQKHDYPTSRNPVIPRGVGSSWLEESIGYSSMGHRRRVEQNHYRGNGGVGGGNDDEGGMWRHDKFIDVILRNQSPERAERPIDPNYKPPEQEWISKAGGVYIPRRSKNHALDKEKEPEGTHSIQEHERRPFPWKSAEK